MADIVNEFLEIKLSKPNKAALKELEQHIVASGLVTRHGDK